VVATGAIAAFTYSESDYATQISMLVVTFLVVSFPCVAAWLAFGTILKKYLDNERRRKWFNFSMAGLLVLSVVPVIWQLVVELA